MARTGIQPMPQPNEQCLGGHAVLCVGYTNDRHFIIRNSWGTGWGQQGYFTMKAEYILDANLSSDFWTLQSISG